MSKSVGAVAAILLQRMPRQAWPDWTERFSPALIAVSLLIFFVVWVALLFAILRLFSVDRTLKEILDELRASREIVGASSVSSVPTPPEGSMVYVAPPRRRESDSVYWIFLAGAVALGATWLIFFT